MDTIRLELNFLDLERNKKNWKIYFVLATEMPDDPDQMAITVVPNGEPIRIRKPADNFISFVPEGDEADGLFILERGMPQDFSVKARLWVMHSRKSIRSAGDVLSEIGDFLGSHQGSNVLKLLGGTNQWITLGIKGIGIVGRALKKMKDRPMGWVNMDEHFNPDGEEDQELERKNRLSTGFGEIGWSWVVDYDD
ncbi:MAG: hypothetical protein AAF693_05685 [Bacteroidota bacterium]